MQQRRNDFDVTNRIQTTDPFAVQREVTRLFHLLHPTSDHISMDRAFADAIALYTGVYPGYLACDTGYHDMQHVMDVTLAMSRLIDGYERSATPNLTAPKPGSLGPRLFQLGIVAALFHDIGYLRKIGDDAAQNGAFYTSSHVSRGALFLLDYLPKIGMGDYTTAGAELIHYTGFEKRVADILIQEPLLRLLGSLLGSADIVAQMSDRCYLEKCRDRLYPEFVAGGVTVRSTADGEEVVFESGEDIIKKTPAFFQTAVDRLEKDLGGAHKYVAQHFGGEHLYLHEVNKNIDFAKQIGDTLQKGSSVSAPNTLRRTPPQKPTDFPGKN